MLTALLIAVGVIVAAVIGVCWVLWQLGKHWEQGG